MALWMFGSDICTFYFNDIYNTKAAMILGKPHYSSYGHVMHAEWQIEVVIHRHLMNRTNLLMDYKRRWRSRGLGFLSYLYHNDDLPLQSQINIDFNVKQFANTLTNCIPKKMNWYFWVHFLANVKKLGSELCYRLTVTNLVPCVR